ncbi:MAG: hypothetical protein V3T33_00975, partial [Myxococcota bacterium]
MAGPPVFTGLPEFSGFPGPHPDWPRVLAEDVGMRPLHLREAVEYAARQELGGPRDVGALITRFEKPPY